MMGKTDKILFHPILLALGLTIVLGASGVEAGEAEITLKRGVAATPDAGVQTERVAPMPNRSRVPGKTEKPTPTGSNNAKISPPGKETMLLLPAIQK